MDKFARILKHEDSLIWIEMDKFARILKHREKTVIVRSADGTLSKSEQL
jgi:hypothetical protein